MSKLEPRLIDHAVMPVGDLDDARARYTALGFSVADNGRHRFGTENACVKFENGTFLEPLAIGHRETVEENEVKGNMFLRRDMGYRFRNGDNGFSCLVFADDNAKATRKEFKKSGYRTGKTVRVRRPGVDARLAFCVDERAPDFSLFVCEDRSPPSSSSKTIPAHANGAVRIARVTACEENPTDFQYYLQLGSGEREIQSHSFGIDFELPNGVVSVFTPDGMKAHYGADIKASKRGLKLVATDIAVKDLNATAALLEEHSIEAKKIGPRLIVSPAIGQGYILAFVEETD